MNQKNIRRPIARLMAVLMSLAMVVSVVFMNASAEKATFTAPKQPMNIDQNLITAAATSMGFLIPEVIGLTNPVCSFRELPANEDGTVGMTYENAQKFGALGVFGSDINENPNPYLYNYFYNTYAASVGATPAPFGTYTMSKDVTPNPQAAKANGGYSKYGITVPATLYTEPDILIGVNPVDEKAGTTGYTAALATYNEAKKAADPSVTEDYAPYQIDYEMEHVYSFLETLYKMSDIADEIMAEDSSKTTRYDDPTIITGDIEKYVKGLEAYVVKRLKEDNAKPVRVAIVDTGYTDTLKKAGTIKAGQYVVNDKLTSTQATTAYSRVGEFVADTSTNIVDIIGNLPKQSAQAENGFNMEYYVVTADQIAENAEVVLFCDVNAGVPESDANDRIDSFQQELATNCTTAALREKVGDIEMMTSLFDALGVIGANVVENLLGMAYYPAYLYPQYLNQFEVAAFWYQNFYHVSDLNKLQSVIEKNFATSSVRDAYAKQYSAATMNYSEEDIEAKIVEGMNYYEDNTNDFKDKLIYQNGRTGENTGWEIDWDNGIGAGQRQEPVQYNGVVKGPDGKWGYYVDDVLQTNYTGIKKNDLGWWRIEKGLVNFNATGIYKNEYGWWRVENGKVNFKAQGIYKNEYGWWKTTDGKVTFKETGVFKNDYGWWRVENSKVNFKANGIYKNPYGWWKTTNGKVTFKENGLFKNEYGTWKVEKSKVNFNYNGTYQGKTVKNGKVV